MFSFSLKFRPFYLATCSFLPSFERFVKPDEVCRFFCCSSCLCAGQARPVPAVCHLTAAERVLGGLCALDSAGAPIERRCDTSDS